jgi:hypothetical protein
MRFSKPFRIFAYLLLTSVTLLIVTSAVLSLFYEQALVRYMKKYLDDHLRTELSMKDIRFKVLRGFPNATVVISNAVLLSGENFNPRDFAGRFSDTLLQARSISFQFDLMKLVNKQYELKKIEIMQGKLNILVDKHNRHNLSIWKSMKQKGEKDYSVHLRSILLNNTKVNIVSAHERLRIAAFSRRTIFRGNYSGNTFAGETRGNLTLDSLTVKDRSLIKGASLHLVSKMAYGEKRLKFNQSRVHLNKIAATVAGEYIGGKQKRLEVTLGISKFGLAELMSLLPADNPVIPDKFAFTGYGKLTAVIRASFMGTRDLYLHSGFELTGCKVRNTETKAEIYNINAKGSVTCTNAEDFALRLDQVIAALDKGTISGSFSLINLNQLNFRAQVRSAVDLSVFTDFAQIESIEQLKGLLHANFVASGSLLRSEDRSSTLLEFLENGTFLAEGVDIKLKNRTWDIRGITGKASWDKILYLDSLSLKVNGNDLLVSGSVMNLADYSLKRGHLTADIQIFTHSLNLDNLLHAVPYKKSAKPVLGNALFPPEMEIKAHIQASNFTAGKFSATDVLLDLTAIKDSVYVNDFSLKFPDGSIKGNALIAKNGRRDLSVTCNSHPQMINIQYLFAAFNNFTQHFIVEKNIRGLLSGSVSFFAQWDSTLKFIPGSLKAQADISITNGELVQFEPMLKLSRYIDVEELRHIRFETLENVIFISDRLVTMPEMAIHSSAFNIAISGQHSFDNVFDYRLKVLLSEVLFNKARKKKKELDEFLVEETKADQTTIPLIIAGTPAKYDVHFDRKRAFNLSRRNFKDDGVSIENKPPPHNFKIEWEESEPVDKTDSINHSRNGSDFLIEWDEEEKDSLEHE